MATFEDVGVVMLRSCNYPTAMAVEVLRPNAIRIVEPPAQRILRMP